VSGPGDHPTPPPADAPTPRVGPARARLAIVLAVVVVAGWLGFRAVRAFDTDRHSAEAAAVLAAPDTVTHELPAAQVGQAAPPPEGPGAAGSQGAPGSPGGRLAYRPGTWLTVIGLRDLEPVAGDERYLVFLRNWAGWTLAGAARPDAAGAAQVRSAAEPRPPTIYEVVVTRAVDDATSVPHGQPVLHWYDGSIAPPRARPFDFARGA
jgi:hypothetical protein